MPDLAELPVMAPIPYTLNIVTISKPTNADDSPSNGALFPAPPLKSAEVDFYLVRDVFITAATWSAASNDVFVCDVGCCGQSAIRKSADVEVMEKVWIPSLGDEKKQRGSWKQEVNFKATIHLTCPPTFNSQLIRVSVSYITVDISIG